jgi:hypothetical protein
VYTAGGRGGGGCAPRSVRAEPQALAVMARKRKSGMVKRAVTEGSLCRCGVGGRDLQKR